MSDFRLEAIREFVSALTKDPRCLKEEDNILYCEKLFKVSGIMNKIYAKLASGEMSIGEMKLYLSYIDEYLNDEADLNWEFEGLTKQPRGIN
jgi:hypothetical protein